MAAAVLLIDINARLAKLEQGLSSANRSLKTFGSGVENLGRMASRAFGALGVGLGAAGIVAGLKNVGERVIEEERSFARLNATLAATQGASGMTLNSLERLNAELKSSSIFDDEQIRQAETALLRFRTVQQDVFEEAMRLAPDVAAALGVDLPEAATALGRALTDPEHGMKALKAAGLALSEQQKDLAARMIESGNKAGAQRIVLDELAKSIGGIAAAENTGLYGATKSASKAWDDFVKSLGRPFSGPVSTGLSAMAEWLNKIIDRAEKAKLTYGDLYRLSIKPGAFLGAASDILQGNDVRGGRMVSGKIGGQVDPEQAKADAAAERARQKEAANQLYLDQQAALQHRAELAASTAASIFAQTKSGIDRESALYQAGYQRNEISIDAFYDHERKAEQDSLLASLKVSQARADAIYDEQRAPSTNRDKRQALEVQLGSISAEQNKERAALQLKLLNLDIQQSFALKALKDDYDDLGVKLAALSGDSVAAAALAFDRSNRDLRERADAQAQSADPARAADGAAIRARLEAMRGLTIQQAELNKATSDYQLTLDAIGNAQARIDIEASAGMITSLDALNKTSDLRRNSIAQLTQELDAARKVADAIAAPEARRQALANIDAMQVKLDELAAHADVLADKFRGIFVDAFTDGFASIIDGTKSVKDAFHDMERSIVQAISRIAAQNIAETIFGKGGIGGGVPGFFSGLFGGGGGAGAGGVLGSLFAKWFSPAAPGPAASINEFSGFGAYAAGGDPPIGRASWVGERGPELFVPKIAGTVIPNHVLSSLRAQRSITYVTEVNVLPGASRQSAAQASAAMARELRINAVRNG